MLIASHLAVVYLGKAGVYTLAAVMGVTDVDPFILSMTQAPASTAAGIGGVGHSHRRGQQQRREGRLRLRPVAARNG